MSSCLRMLTEFESEEYKLVANSGRQRPIVSDGQRIEFGCDVDVDEASPLTLQAATCVKLNYLFKGQLRRWTAAAGTISPQIFILWTWEKRGMKMCGRITNQKAARLDVTAGWLEATSGTCEDFFLFFSTLFRWRKGIMGPTGHWPEYFADSITLKLQVTFLSGKEEI